MRWFYYLPHVLLICLCGVLVLLRAGGHDAGYEAALSVFGMDASEISFLDMHALTAALECYRSGIDVMLANPCDVMGRPHVYPQTWLFLAQLPIDRASTISLGFGIGTAFLGGLFALVGARRAQEIAPLALAFASPATIFALERANNDLIIWLLVLAGARFVAGSGVSRAVAYGSVWLAALLKIYPIMVLVLTTRERRPVCLALILALGGTAAGFLAAAFQRPYQFFQPPTQGNLGSYVWDAFGARNLASALLGNGIANRNLYVIVLLGLVSLYTCVLAVRMVRRYAMVASVSTLPVVVAMPMMAGAAMIVGCFFIGMSINYRAIHLLLVLPGALWIWSEAPSGQMRLLGAVLSWTIVWAMWSGVAYLRLYDATGALELPEAIRIVLSGVIAALRELAWWWLVSVLMALLLCFAVTSPAGQGLYQRWGFRLLG